MTATHSLDRAAIQSLFSLKPRQANYLMTKLCGERSGRGTVIDREALLLKLDEIAGPRGVPSAAVERKARVVEAIDALRREARPRRVSPPPAPQPRAGSPFPNEVSILAPGKMLIDYTSADSVLTSMLGVIQTATNNFAAFEAALEYVPAAECVCTYLPQEAGRPTPSSPQAQPENEPKA
jgi:hypothetical protein